METMINLQSNLELLLEEVTAYNDKPNKSISARVRKQLGEIKKETTGIRSELVQQDAKGYK